MGSLISRRTLAPGARAVQYPRRDGVRVDQAFAQQLGCSEAKAHRILYQHPRLLDVLQAAVQAYREAGDILGLTRLKAAVEAGDLAPVKLTGALFVMAKEADAKEEVLATAYHANPCRATADAFVRGIDKQQLAAATLRAALVQRWAL